jgi:adenylate cyclase
MNVRPRHFVLLCGLIPTLSVVALSLSQPAALANLDSSVYDTVVRVAPAGPSSGRVTIVDVDERSLAKYGQWPWRRDVVGRLIDRVRDLGASVTALDIMFPEPDRLRTSGAEPDKLLAATLQKGRVVLGYAFLFDPTPQPARCAQHPLGLPIIDRGGDGRASPPMFQATSAICNIPVLADAAGTTGFLNAAPDGDGRLRRAPLLIESDGHVYPSLALSAVSMATDRHARALEVANVNAASFEFGDGAIPLDGKSNLLLRFRGKKHTFPYVSAADVLDGTAARSSFQNRIVLIGTTALGTREVVSTPLDTLFTGVEVQATIVDNLLKGDFIQRPGYAAILESQVVLGLGILLALLVGRAGFALGVITATASIAGAWAASVGLMAVSGIFLSPLYPTFGVTGSMAAMGVSWYTIERRRADRAGAAKATSERLMVQSLLSLTEVRDAETGKHSRRTQQYARLIAEALANNPEYRDYLSAERIELLASLAPLHDIGKVGVPDHVLNKPGPLTPEELVEMRKHPIHGRDVILKAERGVGVKDDVTLAMAKDIVYTHHEKWDGTGYPQGLRGAAIPIPGRVMAVVDVWDAAVTRTLYRQPLSCEDAIGLIARGRGTHFDPAVVDAFLRVSPEMRQLAEEAAEAAETSDSRQTVLS